MCGRVSVTTPAKTIAEFFKALNYAVDQPRFNAAPTQFLPAVRVDAETGKRVLLNFYWGLIPAWAKDVKIANRLINARCETLAEKPSFRGAYKYRRCIVAVDGFYEWKKEGNRKQPYYFKMSDDEVIPVAGLWELWTGPAGEEILSCTLITTGANSLMAPIHDRMPVILDKDHFDLWMDPSIGDPKILRSVMKPTRDPRLTCFPVSTYVSSSSNEGPECIQPIESPSGGSNGDGQLNLF